ncbi:MAG: phosphomethylpyrimidine synthase ThiC [Verrucomicrobiota bacterium]|nr:phosphomethylpyrimidine synthase ThiC [Verrucomicrobiota bacterium]
MGAANFSRYGVDLICYITPAEHLPLPNEADVREGVRTTRVACRIGDIAKYPDRKENEKLVVLARRDMRWDDLKKLLMFPDRAKEIRESRMPAKEDICTMCGDFCAIKKGEEIFRNDISGDKRT